ncbi:MAG: ATP-binding cassette domain-containing protein [Candidatus Bathyarchaeia archaeon]
MNESSVLIEVKNLHKWYGKVHAVKGVSFSIKKGEIIGLIGDNGAGKSTLIKILSGYYQPDAGEIYVDGQKVLIRSPSHARSLGIETVYQEQALVDLMSITRNFFMGRELTNKAGFLDFKKMNDECITILRQMGLSINSPATPVRQLSGGEKQGIAIGRAMYFKARIVLLDEPTRNLSVKEVHRVLEFIKSLKQLNISVVFVSHNIYHVYDISDRFLIMAKGELIKDVTKEKTSVEELINTLTIH